MQGVVDVMCYGHPVPYYHFVVIGQGKEPSITEKKCSMWGYAQQKPNKLDVGRILDKPNADSLHKSKDNLL